MKETDESIDIILQDILSGDSHRIWSASCAICSLSQNHEKIIKLLPYKQQIIDATDGIELGGAFATNRRFLERALEIMDFHKDNNGCPCCLHSEDSSPMDFVNDGYFTLEEPADVIGESFPEYCIVRCNNCGKFYKAEPRMSHYIWWDWQIFDSE